jgi:hypothetical protein
MFEETWSKMESAASEQEASNSAQSAKVSHTNETPVEVVEIIRQPCRAVARLGAGILDRIIRRVCKCSIVCSILAELIWRSSHGATTSADM